MKWSKFSKFSAYARAESHLVNQTVHGGLGEQFDLQMILRIPSYTSTVITYSRQIKLLEIVMQVPTSQAMLPRGPGSKNHVGLIPLANAPMLVHVGDSCQPVDSTLRCSPLAAVTTFGCILALVLFGSELKQHLAPHIVQTVRLPFRSRYQLSS